MIHGWMAIWELQWIERKGIKFYTLHSMFEIDFMLCYSFAHRLYILQQSQYGLNMCGEGGEYETFTLDCPLFKKKICMWVSKICTCILLQCASFIHVFISQFIQTFILGSINSSSQRSFCVWRNFIVFFFSDEMTTVNHSDDAFAPVAYLNFTAMHLEDKQVVSASCIISALS